ncbi:MAG TPA: SDR family oxidoreductase [Gaiellaceae bacterium]|nr:SDR family oxidoreductase [Gaiellaceae bacterium]
MEAGNLEWGLAGKPIVVTGASSGIGAATARLLGAAGASVALVGRDEQRLTASGAAVEAAGGKAHLVFAELADDGAPQQIVDETVGAFGGIHGIVHTASLFDPRPLAETDADCIEQQWRVNVMAPLLITKLAVPHMKKGASVIFVASTTGTVGFPGCSAYTATKGAVDAVGRALSVELAPNGIRVNTVVPGYVRTPMLQPHLDAIEGYEDWIVGQTPQARIGGPEELAPSIVFLLSDLSTYVHGVSLVVDGGWVAR